MAIAWTFVAADHSDGAPLPVALLLSACAAVFVTGRLARRDRWLVPLVVVVAAAALFARAPHEALAAAPLGGPLGYVNARGAFFAQAVAAALLLAVIWRRWPLKVAAITSALGFGVVTFIGGSVAAMLSSGVLLATAVAGRSRRHTRLVVAVGAATFSLALAGTTILGASYTRDDTTPLDRIASRGQLWHEGFALMRDHPATGVGPGRFEVESPLARADVDARWAHHAFLQQGAEAGVPGFALVALIFLWGFVRLWFSSTSDGSAAIAAVALAAVGVHACVDYVLHFAAVPIAAAAVLGVPAGGRSAS